MRLRSTLLTAAAVLLTAGAAAAQTFDPERIRADTAWLADDARAGRDTGDAGYDAAAAYVADAFTAAGLRPGAGEGWFQEIEFVRARLTGGSVTIGGQVFPHEGEVIVGLNPTDPNRATEAEAVFVGYGLVSPEDGIDDFAGLDVRGKFIVHLSGAPRGLPSEKASHLLRERGRAAAARGAIGSIGIINPGAVAPAAWERTVWGAREYRLAWVAPSGEAYDPVPGLKAGAGLTGAAVAKLFEGAPRTAADLVAAARDGERPKGFPLAPRVRIESVGTQDRIRSANDLGVLPGSDPALAGERVLVMAHLDGNGVDAAGEGDRIQNGALDNAAGVAVVLEMARAMASAPTKTKRPIVFAALTGEEKGLLGSQYLAKNPVPGGEVVATVNVDNAILTYDFQDLVAFGAEQSELGEIARRAVERAGLKLSPDPVPQMNLFTRSDHYRFVEEGVPSLFLFTGWSGVGQAEFQKFFDTRYHRPSDDMTVAFDWAAAAKLSRLNAEIAREIADAPRRPRWYADSFFGRTKAPDAPKAERPAVAEAR